MQVKESNTPLSTFTYIWCNDSYWELQGLVNDEGFGSGVVEGCPE
jgi:hypothetical protein